MIDITLSGRREPTVLAVDSCEIVSDLRRDRRSLVVLPGETIPVRYVGKTL